jgi:hypothetical protein
MEGDLRGGIRMKIIQKETSRIEHGNLKELLKYFIPKM